MKYFLFCCCIFLIQSSYAGINEFSMHSRANCFNNESISWQKGVSRTLRTLSQHYYFGSYTHTVDTGWQNTWRSAAVHWGESAGKMAAGWRVVGYHYQNKAGRQVLLKVTDVTDCSIYDGW